LPCLCTIVSLLSTGKQPEPPVSSQQFTEICSWARWRSSHQSFVCNLKLPLEELYDLKNPKVQEEVDLCVGFYIVIISILLDNEFTGAELNNAVNKEKFRRRESRHFQRSSRQIREYLRA